MPAADNADNADAPDAAAEAALDRAQFDPARVWDVVAGLVAAGRARDPDAFAAAVGVFSQYAVSQFRNTQRVGVGLVIVTLLEVRGPTPTVAGVQQLAEDIEPEIRRFMRANRWDIAANSQYRDLSRRRARTSPARRGGSARPDAALSARGHAASGARRAWRRP